MTVCRFSLNLTTSDYLAYYRGQAGSIVVLSDNGLKIAFPASALQKFVTHSGVKGSFEIAFSAENKLKRLTRLTN